MSAKRFTAGALLVLATGTCDTTIDSSETSTPPPPPPPPSPATTTVPADAEPPSTTPSVTTSSAAPTTPGSTSYPTTPAEPTMPTTTTVSAGAGAPVATLAPLTADEADVVEALVAAQTISTEARIDPDAPGLDERADALFARSGQQRETLEANRAYLRETGYRSRVNAEQPWQLTIESVTFLDEPYVRAEVVACYFNSNILYEPGGAPDGSDAILNDDVGAQRVLYTMIIEDDAWQLYWGEGLTRMQVGETECPAG